MFHFLLLDLAGIALNVARKKIPPTLVELYLYQANTEK